MIGAKTSTSDIDQFLGRVVDAMTAPAVTLAPDLPAAEAVQALTERGVSGGPVVDHGRVVGVVTLRDLLDLESGPVRSTTGPFMRLDRHLVGVTVTDVMTRQVVSAGQDWPLSRAIVVMDEARVNRLPVLDAEGRPVGILTRGDVIHALARAFWQRSASARHSHPSVLEPD